MAIAEDMSAYFKEIGADANDWMRMYKQVDRTVRSSLQGKVGAELMTQQMKAAVQSAFQEQLPLLVTTLQQDKQAEENTMALQVQRCQKDMVQQVERLMRSTTSEAINSRLIELSDKVNNTCHSILAETGDLKASTGKLLAHQQRYDNAKCNATRGNYAQDEYFDAMDKYFKTAEIIRRHEEGGGRSADFEIIQFGRDPVIIDVKRHERKVDKNHLNKFIRDMISSQKHGALVSMATGISKKHHLEFEVIENKWIAVFVCNAELDMRVLETALNIIEWVSAGLKRFTSDDVVRIAPHTMHEICHQLRQHVDRVKAIQEHILQSEKLCKDLLTLDSIQLQLMHAQPASAQLTPHAQPQQKTQPKGKLIHCDVCDTDYKRLADYNAHLKTKKACALSHTSSPVEGVPLDS